LSESQLYRHDGYKTTVLILLTSRNYRLLRLGDGPARNGRSCVTEQEPLPDSAEARLFIGQRLP